MARVAHVWTGNAASGTDAHLVRVATGNKIVGFH